MRGTFAALAALGLLASPLAARDSLGIFGSWGAFRDANIPRCYAIAQASEGAGYFSVGTWPIRKIRGQVHVRLSASPMQGSAVSLSLAGHRFPLQSRANNAWAADPAMDAAIVAAMRSATALTVSFRDAQGNRVRDRYELPGVASALDAATVACARR